jgi:hypothetical protein
MGTTDYRRLPVAPTAVLPTGAALVRQLIGRGALDIDTKGRGGLFAVADKARPILRGEQNVMFREAGIARPRRRRESELATQGSAPGGRATGGRPFGGPTD